MKKIGISIVLLMVIGFPSFLSLHTWAAPKWPIPEGIKTIEVNGYDMAYQETGSGIPLVLLHLHPADYRTWDTQVHDFSKVYRTIAVSLRHYYPEQWNGVGNDFSIAQHASDVEALIKKLNLGKVHLLGASRGGTVALTVARHHPEAIRTLILEEPNMEAIMPETPEKQNRVAKAKERGQRVRANLATGGREKAAQEWVESYSGSGAWEKTPERIRQVLIENIGVCTDIGERGELTCADIQKLNFPVLLLNGEKSPKHYGEMITAIRRCNPNIPDPTIVPNAAHLMHRQNPTFFNKVVLDFLSKH